MSRPAIAAASLLVLLAVGGALSVRDETAPDVSSPAGAAPVSLMSSCRTPPIDEPYVVNISGFAYCPPNGRVTAGVEVVWTNLDLAPHSVTYDGPDGRVDSGSMSQGQRWATRFNVPGTYGYYCRFHPGMTGTIVVDARP
jgi:manganese oxidase